MLLALASSLLAAAPLHLLDPAPAPFEARAPARLPVADPDAPTWYGWEPFLADGTAVTFLVGAFYLGEQRLVAAQTVMIVTSVGIYVVGGPLLHLSRGRPSTALVDLGLRVGLPVAGMVGGLWLGLITNQSGLWTTLGILLGFAAAILTDAVGLSWEPPRDAAQADQVSLRWAPFVGAARGSPLAGVAGTF